MHAMLTIKRRGGQSKTGSDALPENFLHCRQVAEMLAFSNDRLAGKPLVFRVCGRMKDFLRIFQKGVDGFTEPK